MQPEDSEVVRSRMLQPKQGGDDGLVRATGAQTSEGDIAHGEFRMLQWWEIGDSQRTDQIDTLSFLTFGEGSFKYGKGENLNKPYRVRLELEVLVYIYNFFFM